MSEFLKGLEIDINSFEADIVKRQREKLEGRALESQKRYASDEALVEELGFSNPWDSPEDSKSGLSELDLSDSRSISRIYEILKELRQWEVEPGTFCKRLVRLKTWIDSDAKFYAEKNWHGMEMPELIMCSGLFAVLEVYFVPMKYVSHQRDWNPHLGMSQDVYVINQSEFGKGLPSTQDVAYYTFQPISESCGVCLTLRGGYSWLRDYITRIGNWEFVQCDL